MWPIDGGKAKSETSVESLESVGEGDLPLAVLCSYCVPDCIAPDLAR